MQIIYHFFFVSWPQLDGFSRRTIQSFINYDWTFPKVNNRNVSVTMKWCINDNEMMHKLNNEMVHKLNIDCQDLPNLCNTSVPKFL